MGSRFGELFVVVEQLLVVFVVFEVFEARGHRGNADADEAVAERAAERDRLAVFEDQASWQRTSFEHELLLGHQALATRLLARRQARARRG